MYILNNNNSIHYNCQKIFQYLSMITRQRPDENNGHVAIFLMNSYCQNADDAGAASSGTLKNLMRGDCRATDYFLR